jgi:hypothetical protein
MAEIRREAVGRGITRLCHFTPYRNLVHIVTGTGLHSTEALSNEERRAFNQQDVQRLDRHPDHISCAIEYPNAWYFRQKRWDARGDAALFRTWVVVSIDPHYLWDERTRFCHRNAAARDGAFIRDGLEGFLGLYAESVLGSGNRTYTRQRTRISASPTDDQAEVLVWRYVPLSDVQTIAAQDEDQARLVYAGLRQIGGEPERFPFTVVPEFFQPSVLSAMIARGERPHEPEWDPSAYG